MKVIHNGVAASLRHIQSVFDGKLAAGIRIATEILPSAEVFSIVVHAVKEDVNVRVAFGVVVPDDHVLGVAILHQFEVFLRNPPHSFIVQQGRIRLYET